MKYDYGRVVVKIGSNVLTLPSGKLDTERMKGLVAQIAELHRSGVEVILVSSGAVASGRGVVEIHKSLDAVSSRQLFSAVGQVRLINKYYELFEEHNITCGQVLTTKENFSTRHQYLNQKNCIEVMLYSGIIPIVNENDTVSVTELMFTDNDELSGMLATMASADALVILSNIDGVYNGNPSEATSEVIRRVERGEDISSFISQKRSGFGRGGMVTKYRIAQKVADEGVEVIIANGCTENILSELLRPASDMVSTRFTPADSISGVKKWIAHSESFTKGEIHINEGAAEALLAHSAVSLLAVGVTRIVGDFHLGDIVKIFDNHGTQIGLGRSSYSSEAAVQNIGTKDIKPFVHYDYLYIGDF